jgi:integrase
MHCDEMARIWTERWPRPSDLSQRQHKYMVQGWGEENAGVPLRAYTREKARLYSQKHPSRCRFLRALFNDAIGDGLATENPFAALRTSPPRRTLTMPTPQELEMLLRAAEEPLKGRIAFAAYTGLRRGELLHLRPCDFERSGVAAGRSEPEEKVGTRTTGEVPTASGDSASTEKRLGESNERDQLERHGQASSNLDESSRARGRWRVHVEWQINANGKKARIKGRVKDRWAIVPKPAHRAIAGLLLENSPDRPLWPVAPRRHDKQWQKVRETTRLTHLRFHDLRHFAASWFLDHGASFHDVGVQLGHDDSGREVRETYGHLDRGKALERLEGLIGGKS